MLPLSEAKAKLSQLVDDLANGGGITITRHGRPVAMLVPPDAYESWEATLEIVSDTEFMADIRAGIRELDEGRVLGEEAVYAILDDDTMPSEADIERLRTH